MDRGSYNGGVIWVPYLQVGLQSSVASRPQIQICNIIAECHAYRSTEVFLRAKVVVTTKHAFLQMCRVSHVLPKQVL